MGNCHCRPKEGGESLKEFLTRKFHKLAKKRRIDDLVNIAIHLDGEEQGGQSVDLQLIDLEDDVLSDCMLEYGSRSIYRTYDDLTKSTETVCKLSPNEIWNRYTEQNETIRILQRQLQEVQTELDNLQRGQSSRPQITDTGTVDAIYKEHGSTDDKNKQVSHGITGVQRSRKAEKYGFVQAQGDVIDKVPQRTEPQTGTNQTSAAEKETTACKADDKVDLKDEVDERCQSVVNTGRKSRLLGRITEGLRTRSDTRPKRKDVRGRLTQAKAPEEAAGAAAEAPVATAARAAPVTAAGRAAPVTAAARTTAAARAAPITAAARAAPVTAVARPTAAARAAPVTAAARTTAAARAAPVTAVARPTAAARAAPVTTAARAAPVTAAARAAPVTAIARPTAAARVAPVTAAVRPTAAAKTAKVKQTADVDPIIADKIAAIQKKDPNAPRPDKGVKYPKTMENILTKEDKAYYVEQFMRSELFRQRCLKKYQGSKIWKNALTPFQIWVIENEDTPEMEATLNPFPHKPENTAQAKVNCWRGRTPPPQPMQF